MTQNNSNDSSKSDHEIERQLIATYAEPYSFILSVGIKQARDEINKGIQVCKKLGREEGTDQFPKNFGDILVEEARLKVPCALKMVRKIRDEGATEEDIKEWWNMHDLERRMMWWSEQVHRFACFKSFMKDEGLNADEAMGKVRMMFPFYGNPLNTEHVQGDDRPLPHELKCRIDRYREKWGARAIKEFSASHTTYNAFIRAEIKEGKLDNGKL